MERGKDESRRGLLEDGAPVDSPHYPHDKTWKSVASISLAINGVLSLFLLWSLSQTVAVRGRVSTDFRPLPSAIRTLTPTTFDDRLMYNESSGHFWRDLNPSLPQYFGNPGPEIDAAWANLLAAEFIGISDIEANDDPHLNFVPADRRFPGGPYVVAIGVMHSLHCLNAVRKELDKDYYHDESPLHMTGLDQRQHIDHCLNHVRQSLQCHPDLSPAAMRRHSTPHGNTFYLGNAVEHTCYDWSELRKWHDERAASRWGAFDD